MIVRCPAGSVMTLVWGVSRRMLPLLARNTRDADCVGGAPPGGCVLVAQSEHEGGVGGGEVDFTVRNFITPFQGTTFPVGSIEWIRLERIHSIRRVLAAGIPSSHKAEPWRAGWSQGRRNLFPVCRPVRPIARAFRPIRLRFPG